MSQATSSLPSDPSQIEFYLAVDVLYHGARAGFLMAAHRLCMFLAIVAGSAAAASFARPEVAGVFVAAITGADLCFDFVGRAQVHFDLRRRLMDLVSDLARGGPIDSIRERWLGLSADEPPSYNVAQEIAHNSARLALDRLDTTEIVIPAWKRALAHLCRF